MPRGRPVGAGTAAHIAAKRCRTELEFTAGMQKSALSLPLTGSKPNGRARGRIRRLFLLPVLLAAAALIGCGLWRPTSTPLRTIALPAPCTLEAKSLLVFLPGSYSLPEDYLDRGFVDLLRRRGVAADVLLVDAHLGYYSERSILERLQQDVIGPARARGYDKVWLIGISIGAFGALLHAARAAGPEARIDGIVAIGPYLGERGLTQRIRGAGGLAAWRAPPPLASGEADATLWRWLQQQTAKQTSVDLYLAYGDRDRFAFAQRLLAAALPPGHVFTVAGGHDWKAWQALWQKMAPALPLATAASCRDGASDRPGASSLPP